MIRCSRLLQIVILVSYFLGPTLVSAQDNGKRDEGNDRSAMRNRDREDGERRGRRGRRENREGKGERNRGDSKAAKQDAEVKPANAAAPVADKSDADKAVEYASTTIAKYDKNGDNMLQENEQSEMSSMTKKADTNGDRVITKNELVALSLGRSKPAPTVATASHAGGTNSSVPEKGAIESSTSDPTSSKSSSTANDAKSKTAGNTRKSYRFKPAKERLPSGLPGWFTSKDANGDGQVSMSEYNKSWNDRTATEFQTYDADNDGVITSHESQKSK